MSDRIQKGYIENNMIEKGNLSELKNINLFLFDMDGTLYLGYDLFPFTKELLSVIKAQGKTYKFVTNNSSRSVSAYVEKLARLGIEADENDMVTSTQATALYINQNYKGVLFYASGTESFKTELKELGVNITDELCDGISGVVTGFDTELTFKKLEDMSKLLLRDIPFIAANPDLVCPTEFGYVPDCGSVCGMLFNSTGKKPYYIGKPRPEMANLTVETVHRLNPRVTKETTLMIGDRMYTDIASGINAGVKTMLVLSGETTEAQAKETDYKIDYIVSDCGRLLEILKKSEDEEK